MKGTLLVIISLLSASTTFAGGRYIIVDDDDEADFNNIQAAIDDSNDGDIIYVFPGRYTGPGNRDIDFKGRAVTVQSVVPEDPYFVSVTVIDCNGSAAGPHRAFYFHSAEDANSVLAGFTITNGYADEGGAIRCSGSSPTIDNCLITGNVASQNGGAMSNYRSSPMIRGCTFSQNRAVGNDAGAIDNVDSAPSISDCNFSRNLAWDWGGAIRNIGSGSPTITNCSFVENSADDGGAIFCSAHSKVGNCTLSGNSARYGGGICSAGTPRIENCLLVNNHTSKDGGGLYSEGGGKVIRCQFNGNSAANGGAVYYGQSGLALTSCTLSGNWSAVNGGGIYCASGSPLIGNCTLSSNVAASAGGGLYAARSGPEFTNCIFWANTDANGIGESAQIDGAIPDVTYSCIQDDNPDDGYIPFGGDANGNTDDNPMFVRDPYDGGDGWGVGDNDDYGDLHIQEASPCVNAGNAPAWYEPDSVDIDGEPRVMGAVVDMGADELFMPTIAVTRPKGGEMWVAGSIHEIQWYSVMVSGLVDVLFSKDASGGWQTIETGLADTGSYMLSLPDIVDSNQCTLKVVPSIPDANVVCIESELFTVRPDSPDRTAASKWKSLGGDFDRKGLSENYGPELGCVKWSFETGGAISASVTIGPNDTVYVPCSDGRLYRLDANGVLLWSYDANSPLLSSATIGPDGTAYVGAGNGKLYSIDISGRLRWVHSTDGFIYSSPAISPDGRKIYVCSQDGRLYALGRDGSELWTFETAGFGTLDGAIFASPSVGPDGTVYISGLYDPNLYALDPNDGSIKWVCHFQSGGWPFASPVIAPDGTIYQTLLYDANLYAVKPDEPNAGSIIWSTYLSDTSQCSTWFEPNSHLGVRWDTYCGKCCYRQAYYNDVSSSGFSEPAIGPDGTVYASFDDPYLRAVDPNGSIRWIRKLGTWSGFTLTVGSDGLIYAATEQGYLYVVKPNGQRLARFGSANWPGFPVISADNTVVVGDTVDNTALISYENNRVWYISTEACQGQDPDLYWYGTEDLDGDGAVNFTDFCFMAANWLKCTDCRSPYCSRSYLFFTADMNRDQWVNWADLAILVDKWLNGY
ncbi:MAG TPA: PQQ-binding-like beta-propeller repeat protein [Sedimentisphaerales bacterium]|nr:PQQ-binding-like beta-propeller repeat protein [Sedimentisphaerales bacterium]